MKKKQNLTPLREITFAISQKTIFLHFRLTGQLYGTVEVSKEKASRIFKALKIDGYTSRLAYISYEMSFPF